MKNSMETNIRYLKGIGEKKAELFNKLGVHTVGDLLTFFPRAYENWISENSIHSAPLNTKVCIKAVLSSPLVSSRGRGGMLLCRGLATDGPGIISLLFFNNKYISQSLKEGEEYLFYGVLKLNDYGTPEMISPKVIKAEGNEYMHPVYPQTGSLNSTQIRNAVKTALTSFGEGLPDMLPEALIKKYRLEGFYDALLKIHFPKNEEDIFKARRRLIFEELLSLQLGILSTRQSGSENTGTQIKTDYTSDFLSLLPFSLTSAQSRSIKECVTDMQKKEPMRRLVQGDVGSGKTAVAAAVMHTCAKNGFQSVLMAPTEVLANQHLKTFRRFFENTDINVDILTGSMGAKAKREAKERLKNGETDILIGTHAVITDDVEYSSLGLVVTDEQHRFGVCQRAKLREKGENPHVLVMSATPIPRTLSLIIYGDLDISILDEKPAGRRSVKTYAVDTSYRERIYNFIKKQADSGRQAYIVCPLATENEDEDTNPFEEKSRLSAEEYIKQLSDDVFKGYSTGLLHGKMKPKEKDAVMKSFSDGEIQILFCTVVVEVGIDVSNATLMVIENAECFGLSQLHQLRGRTGRGNEQSYCVLISDSKSEHATRRFRIMSETNDGFKIADEDLKMRGPGDFFGNRQSGLPNLRLADLMSDTKILYAARTEALEIIKNDPSFSLGENKMLKVQFSKLFTDIS